MKDFTSQQREIVARKLGYDGPMQGFDDFIASSPSLGAKYAAITGKFAERMAKGGLVKMKPRGYAYGGPVYSDEELFQRTGSWEAAAAARDEQNKAIIAARDAEDKAAVAAAQARGGVTNQVVADWWSNPENQKKSDSEIKDLMDQYRVTPEQFASAIKANEATSSDISNRYFAEAERDRLAAEAALAKAQADAAAAAAAKAKLSSTTGAVTGGTDVTYSATGVPQAGDAAQVSAAQIVAQPNQNIDTTARADETANIATPAQAITASTAAAPSTAKAATYTAQQTAGDITDLLRGVTPALGTVGKESQVVAQTMAPTSTAVGDLQAVQGKATQVTGAPTRVLGEGETVSSAVDMAKAAETVAATQQAAAQGVVTEEMTVQGQLNKLMANFDAGNPPPWAAANLRSVTAVLAARGLGASSLAGQALIQATLESALPIASADAQAYQAVATQNLSNRQQTAVLAAQQRAAFLGQEFDQAFQSRVTNAARVADVANMNFTAQQQIALENARLAQTMDLANMSNSQALVLAEAAQIAALETTNLNNKQQAAVVNAQAFLQMDMANLSNQQQTTLFKTQQMTQALLSDAASTNAALQFNAASITQVDQFNNTLSTQVSQFNASQKNAIAQFNVDQENALAKFNAEAQNQREVFNAQQRLVIDQANAQWQREIATANTAATNAANMMNAQLSQQMTLTEYNNEIQLYRDSVTHAWQSAENDANRATTLAAAEISAAASVAGAEIKADGDSSAAIGGFVGRVLLGKL